MGARPASPTRGADHFIPAALTSGAPSTTAKGGVYTPGARKGGDTRCAANLRGSGAGVTPLAAWRSPAETQAAEPNPRDRFDCGNGPVSS
jgi:hypothetical protein